MGVIKPVASQPPPWRDVEEMLEHDLDLDWDEETVERWAYMRRDMLTREIFQAPRIDTPVALG